MATLDELRTLVSNIIQDTQFTDDMIDEYLNDGVMEIAAGMESSLGSFITPPLPNLLSIGTVDTDIAAAFVAMPETFQRDLRMVVTSSGVEVDIANSFIEFGMDYPLMNRSGSVVDTIEFGGNLYYQGIPTTAETLTLHFYRLPVEMTDDDDTPDGLPLPYHKKLLVNYACKEIFALIEDGIEAQPVNTAKHTQLFLAALRALELSIPADGQSLLLGAK